MLLNLSQELGKAKKEKSTTGIQKVVKGQQSVNQEEIVKISVRTPNASGPTCFFFNIHHKFGEILFGFHIKLFAEAVASRFYAA